MHTHITGTHWNSTSHFFKSGIQFSFSYLLFDLCGAIWRNPSSSCKHNMAGEIQYLCCLTLALASCKPWEFGHEKKVVFPGVLSFCYFLGFSLLWSHSWCFYTENDLLLWSGEELPCRNTWLLLSGSSQALHSWGQMLKSIISVSI